MLSECRMAAENIRISAALRAANKMVTIFGSTFFAIDLRFSMFQFDVSCLHAALQLSPVFSKGVGRYVFLTKAYSYPCAGLEGSL